MRQDTLEQMLYQIKTDLASVKTDVAWLKRLFVAAIIFTGALFGINVSGVVI